MLWKLRDKTGLRKLENSLIISDTKNAKRPQDVEDNIGADEKTYLQWPGVWTTNEGFSTRKDKICIPNGRRCFLLNQQFSMTKKSNWRIAKKPVLIFRLRTGLEALTSPRRGPSKAGTLFTDPAVTMKS